MVGKTTKQTSSMHVVQSRTETFFQTYKVGKTRVRWPHTKPEPESLALAGFYYQPYGNSEDNVVCYLCGKMMGGWEETDDPLKEHLRGNKSCAWAILRDIFVKSKNGEEYGPDAEDPRSEVMNALREATFGKWWPHDDKKGWNPKAKKMAQAGFIYASTDESEDFVNCPYCLIGLDGWEPRDDPMKEHQSRTPTCPFFIGFSSSAPTSGASSPVKVEPTPIPRSSRKSGIGMDNEPAHPSQIKNKRLTTRQATFEYEEETLEAPESPPPSKRRKSSRIVSQSSQDKSNSPPQSTSSGLVQLSPVPKRSDRRNIGKSDPSKPSVMGDIACIKTPEASPPSSTTNRRITRSAATLPPPEDTLSEPEDRPKEELAGKAKRKQSKAKTRKVSLLARIVNEIDKAQPRRITRSGKELDQEPSQPEEQPATKVEEPKAKTPKRRQGRESKVMEPQREEEQAPMETTSVSRRTRQSIVLGINEVSAEEPVVEHPAPAPTPAPKRLTVPKRKKITAKTDKAAFQPVRERSETDEAEPELPPRPSARTSAQLDTSVVEISDEDTGTKDASEPEEVHTSFSRGRGRGKRGRGRGRGGRGRSSTLRGAASPPRIDEESPPKPAARGRSVSKRNISVVDKDTTEPPAKRKSTRSKSVQRIPTPSDDSDDDFFEDSKSTFSDEAPSVNRKQRPRRGGPAIQSATRRKVGSEERELDDGPSRSYHSADDYLSSPTHSNLLGKSKREMVDNAKKELEEEIWKERVANGEIIPSGSSDDDEKENALEEKGKKPTRTVRRKGSKGRKAKGNNKKSGKITPAAADISEKDGEESAGESHALVVKAMISPLQPGPVLEEELPLGEISAEQHHSADRQVTPAQLANRNAPHWTPAKVEGVPAPQVANGDLTEQEEEMTVEQWMRWVINDEVRRLEQECEKLVRNLEREGIRARRVLENLVAG